MTRYLCVITLVSAGLLPAPDTSLEKFEENMKKKWDSILEKHPIDLASTTDLPEALAMPTSTPDDHILDSLRQLDESTAAPTLFAALDAVSTTAAPTADDISKQLERLKMANTEAKLQLDSETTAAPEVSDLLAHLKNHIDDVHSSVHDALDGSLNHPGIKPAVDSLSTDEDDASSDDDKKGGDLSNLMMPPAEGDEAPTKDDSEADPAAAGDAAPMSAEKSAEKEAAMEGMKRLMGAVKMIVMLQPMLEPLKEKLSLALEHMSPEDAKKAESILNHIKVLGVYSKVTAGLMAGVVAAKQGTAQDREKAIATLIVGVKQIQEKVAKHLIEMKQETMALPHSEDADAPDASPDAPAAAGDVHEKHANQAMDKMTALLVKLGKKIATEIKDPANRHNPKVLLDIKLFLAVKDSVEKTQALMMAGSIAIKKAKTSEEKEAVQAAVKKGMGKVEATLKEKMMALEKQALILAVAAAKQHEAEKAQGSAEDAGDEDAPDAKKADKNKAKDDGDDDSSSGDDDDDSSSGSSGSDANSGSSGSGSGSSSGNQQGAGDSSGDDDDDSAEAKKASTPKKSGLAAEEAEAKKNNPGISAADIEHIFEEAADDATAEKKAESLLQEHEVHLRAH